MIRLENIHMEYDGVVLLENEKISISANKITVIKGASGSGKTALLYRIALIANDTKFTYYYDDKIIDLNDESLKAQFRKSSISYVLQESDMLSHLSVEQTLFHHAQFNQCDLEHQEMMDLLHVLKLDVTLNQNIMTLSLGERQRLAIACALIKQPKLLILDEPTASLDYDNEVLIYEVLRSLLNKGITIVISSHSAYINDYGDIIYQIKDKQIKINKGQFDDTPCLTNENKKIRYPFFLSYIKRYIKYYQFIYIIMIMVMTISFLSCNLITGLISNAANNSKEILIGQFDNKIIITKDNQAKYVDDDYISYIDNFEYKDAYPLYQMKTMIADDDIYIVPYFQKDDFGKYLESVISDDANGIYIDNQSFYSLKASEKLNSTFVIDMINEGNIYQMSREFIINGVFKKSVVQHYSSKGDRFIYMPYHLMDKLLKQYISPDRYLGYVILFDSYDELKIAKEELEKQGYNINDSFTNIEAIDDIDNYYLQLNITIVGLILLLTLLIDLILCFQLYFKRRKEITLLKVNGLENKHIHLIFLIELFVELAVVLAIVTIIEVVILFSINAFTVTNLSAILKLDIFYVVALIITRMLSIYRYLPKIKIETELRND